MSRPRRVPVGHSLLGRDPAAGSRRDDGVLPFGLRLGLRRTRRDAGRRRVLRGQGRRPGRGGDRLAPHALEGPARWTTFVSVDDLEETLRKVEAGGGVVRVPPVDADPAGRLAVFTDPQGAELALWQAAARVGAQVLNQPSAWAMSALHTDDRDGALAFYRDVFGWEPEPFGPVICWRRPGYVGGEPSQPVPRDVVAVLMDLGPETATGSQPHWSVDFWIADADAAAQQTESAGGRVVEPTNRHPGLPDHRARGSGRGAVQRQSADAPRLRPKAGRLRG